MLLIDGLFSTWPDVTMLSIKDNQICIASDTFHHSTKCDLKVGPFCSNSFLGQIMQSVLKQPPNKEGRHLIDKYEVF